MKRIGLEPGLEGKTVIVQGMGNVGYYAAKYFHEAGAKVVCLIEFDGAIYNPKGPGPRCRAETPQRNRLHHELPRRQKYSKRTLTASSWNAISSFPPRSKT